MSLMSKILFQVDPIFESKFLLTKSYKVSLQFEKYDLKYSNLIYLKSTVSLARPGDHHQLAGKDGCRVHLTASFRLFVK